LSVVGLFAGIGGIEVGLHEAGHRTELLCEIDEAAQRVLTAHFPDVPLIDDVRELEELPNVDLVAAGFPCQDLSQAGTTAGIKGDRSGLVGKVFELLERAETAQRAPTWLLLENVPFMLQLDRGRAMHFLTDELQRLGYTWAYRVVDTRAFGLPQRRQRVLLLASRTEDPRTILFADDAGRPAGIPDDRNRSAPVHLASGFYWTEGIRGLGWAVDAIPTLKGGSTVGIPSPPAIWDPADGSIGTPDLRDAERLQGFPDGWTAIATPEGRRRGGARWKLVGNAVSVPVARWLGRRLVAPGSGAQRTAERLEVRTAWPRAAWGHRGQVYRAEVSEWPITTERPHLLDYLRYPIVPLSARATAGFLDRTYRGYLNFVPGFREDVARHLARMRAAA
jgi:DNA (cytosine-5)-methyltransferase 1